MANIKLEDFKAQYKDGSRSNRFWVTITGAQGGAAWVDTPFSFLVKSFSLPARTIGEIIVNYQGLQAKFAGDVTMDDMTMILHNDVGFKIKTYFEKWLKGIVDTQTNTRNVHSTYQAEIMVEQLGNTGETLAKYKILGCFPKQMDAIELSHENVDQFEELSITFACENWERM